MGKLWDRGANPRILLWNAFHQHADDVLGWWQPVEAGCQEAAWGTDDLGRPECSKLPVSHPGARAGVIWLETGGAGESYTSVSLMRAGEAGAGRRIQELAIG